MQNISKIATAANQSELLLFQQQTAVRQLHTGGTIIGTEFRERCWIYQSFHLTKDKYGDDLVHPAVSLLADSGNGSAASWDTRYGPIEFFRECDEGYSEEDDSIGLLVTAKPHFHFSFVENRAMAWSQLAVYREGLKGKLCSGDINGVFDVLMRWAESF